MAKKKKETMELRVYEVPQGHLVLPLYGDSWVRIYGHEQQIFHFHNLMELGICRYGHGELRTPDKSFEYMDGHMSIFPANFPHTTYSYGEQDNFWEYLFFDPKAILSQLYADSPMYVNDILQKINSKDIMLTKEDAPELYSIVDIVIKEASEKRHFHHLAMNHLMCLLILEIMRLHDDMPYYSDGPAKTSNSIPITKAIDYIMDNIKEPIKVSDLADACGLSETHFRRIFNEYVDMSPSDYVNLCRVQKACELMKKGSESMELVAEAVGFSNVSTFNRNFKKFLDTSPYHWKIDPQNYESKLNKYKISPKQGW